MTAEASIVARALALLGKHNLVLSLHDPSFPGAPGEDTGRGSPYTRGGRDFLEFVAGLGFTGLQLGPQGQTSAGNPSPYDGTIFARNVLSIDLFALADDPQWAGVLARATCERISASARAGRRVDHGHVHAAYSTALAQAHAGFVAARRAGDRSALALDRRIAEFTRVHAAWLERDALFEALVGQHREADWRRWSDPTDRRLYDPGPGEVERCMARRQVIAATHHEAIDRFIFKQFVAHAQHDQLRALTRRLGLKLYGDLQIGVSPQDLWSYGGLFLADYRMGAPPSRTNPDGQPWNYAVLDPAQYHHGAAPGPALKFMSARVDKLLGEFDGLRIDHPHGHVCPWVYRWTADADAATSLRAVQSGARLFASPDLPDHPALARHAIARPEQLDRDVARHADGWVRGLDDDQVDEYSALFDAVVAAATAHRRERGDLLCEVLSTQPYPLARVMQRHGLGRFRVTQKADLHNPADVYRSENAAPADWIMVGNHDTPTIWQLVARWQQDGTAAAQADYLARRLAPAGADIAALAARLAADPRQLAQAKFADILASPAHNVLVFFADLLGYDEAYNVPGTVNALNWSLRVGADYREAYAAQRTARQALHLPAIVAMALRRAAQPDAPGLAELLAELDTIV